MFYIANMIQFCFLMEQPVYIYHIDENDVIFYINEEYIKFAVENDGERLVKESLGKPIWNFITNGLVKKLYQELIAAIRKTKESVKISFRCDSPDRMRFMQMEVFPLIENGVAFHNILLREKFKADGYTPDIIAILGEAGYPMCSHCNKIKIDENWFELEDALKGKLLQNKNLKAHYSICKYCNNDLKNSIEELKMKVMF